MGNEVFRIGEKIVCLEKITRQVRQILALRQQGLSQQEVAARFGLDRAFLSRLEGLGAVRRGASVAVVGFPIRNKAEVMGLLEELGVDFALIMTNAERWRFVEERSGAVLFNEILQLIARIRTYDVVVLIGSRQRISWGAALLDKEVVGIELGESPLTEDVEVDLEYLRSLILNLRGAAGGRQKRPRGRNNRSEARGKC